MLSDIFRHFPGPGSQPVIDHQHKKRRAADQSRGVAALNTQGQHENNVGYKHQRGEYRRENTLFVGLFSRGKLIVRGGSNSTGGFALAAEHDEGRNKRDAGHHAPQRQVAGYQRGHCGAGGFGRDGRRALNKEVAGQGHAVPENVHYHRRPYNGHTGAKRHGQQQRAHQRHGGGGPDAQ